jgi:phosphate transport system substrate-binding protein
VRSIRLAAAGAASILALGVAACGSDDNSDSGGSSNASASSSENLSGNIRIDGSSTVFPFAQAAAELFSEEQPNVKVTVGESGTGGGFEKFCAGETDISDASRPIKKDDAKEGQACDKAGIKYGEVQIANDGIAVVTNKDLKVDCLTTDELKKLWNKGSKVTDLSTVKSGLPNTKLSLYGPGTDSGTFDFFTGAINGEEGVTRDDYQASEDDNQLVQGVAGDAGGLGYFGFSYYEGNTDKLNLVGVDAGGGCIKPAKETIQDGSYKPLSRPLFMYPKSASIAKPAVKAFMTFVVENQDKIAEAAKIVPLTPEQVTAAKSELQKAEAAS